MLERSVSIKNKVKIKFIMMYSLIGFISCIGLIIILFSQEIFDNKIFLFAVIGVLPVFLVSFYFAKNQNLINASYPAIITLLVGSFTALTIDFNAFVPMIMIFILSVMFITVNNWQVLTLYIFIIIIIIVKVLIEYEIISTQLAAPSEIPIKSLNFIMIFMISIVSYIIVIGNIVNKGMDDSDQLAKTSQKLKDAVAIKDRFISLISHDLRGPIGSMSQLLNALFQKEIQLNDEILKALKDSSSQTTSLLNNLLKWSSIQQNTFKYEPKSFDLSECINETIELLSSSTNNKKIEVINKLDYKCEVFADQSMINTVFRNLLNNAIKFSHEKSKVEVYSEDLQDFIKVFVKDYGIGISNKLQNNLFSDFYQKKSMLGTAGESGTGIGLTLAKDFVKVNKGEIGVISKENEGSTFWFSVPKSK